MFVALVIAVVNKTVAPNLVVAAVVAVAVVLVSAVDNGAVAVAIAVFRMVFSCDAEVIAVVLDSVVAGGSGGIVNVTNQCGTC